MDPTSPVVFFLLEEMIVIMEYIFSDALIFHNRKLLWVEWRQNSIDKRRDGFLC